MMRFVSTQEENHQGLTSAHPPPHTHTQERPHEHPDRRQLSANREESPHQGLKLPAHQPWTAQPPGPCKMYVYSLSHPGYGVFYSRPSCLRPLITGSTVRVIDCVTSSFRMVSKHLTSDMAALSPFAVAFCFTVNRRMLLPPRTGEKVADTSLSLRRAFRNPEDHRGISSH